MDYSFLNDYNEICHKDIYNYIGKYINEKTLGYEEDEFCKKAKEVIINKFSANGAMIQFFIGGTSANLVMISHMLNKSYEGVIATKYSHIANHEGGAIEGSGHKILIADDFQGKIKPESIEKIYLKHLKDNHMVIPKMVYISNVTEVGTIYKLEELKKIHEICKKYNLYLYLDGARLFTALSSKKNNIKMEDYKDYVDAFYIGGTKNGLMLGEACVILNNDLKCDFMRHMKNKGAMLAKGSLIGLNFLALFENNLFEKISSHSNAMAEKLVNFLKEKGYEFAFEPEANLIFVKMEANKVEKLSKVFAIDDEGYVNKDKKLIRLVTSFTTREEDLKKLFNEINKL